MTSKDSSKPKRGAKISEAERHKRFKEMAKEVGASEDAKDFESAFRKAAGKPAEGK